MPSRPAVPHVPTPSELHRGGIPADAPRAAFDRLARVAAALLDAPLAVVSVAAAGHPSLQGCYGSPAPGALAAAALCPPADSPTALFLEDARRDAATAGVRAFGALDVAGYAGVPLATPAGELLGTLAVADRRPRRWTVREREALGEVAALAVGEIALRAQAAAHRAAAAEHEHEQEALAAALEATADGILVLDQAWRITAYNQQFVAIWGIPAEVLAAGTDEAAVSFVLDQLADPDEFLARKRELQANPFAASHDVIALRDGRVLERFTRPQRLGGEVVGRVWSFRDVTEARRVEATQQKSEARFRALYERAAVGIALTDIAGAFEQANPSFCEMLGYTEAELCTLSRVGITHPDDRGCQAELTARLLAGDARSHSVEKRYLRKDGSVAWGRATVSVIRDAADAPQHLIAVIEDISERKGAQEALRESEARYRSLFDHHPDAVYSLDTEGRFLSANPACEALSGYDPAKLLGTLFAPLLVPEHLAEATAHFRDAVAGSATSYEIAIRHQSGRRVELGVTNVPIVVGGQVAGVFGIARDLTVQRQLEAQLRQAQKMEAVGRLAGGIAHDFNNILTVITSYGSVLQAELPEASASRADVAEIQAAADRAATLTQQLLAFSRQQPMQAVVLDLNEVVGGVRRMLDRMIGEDVMLTVEPAAEPALVAADPVHVEQVLMNLAVNARDAMPNGGRLSIAVEHVDGADAGMPPLPDEGAGDYVALRVTDTGTGMSEETQAHIFEPFFTTKAPGMGTGLGLATVYGIVEQAGGAVRVQSAPGRGTTFVVLLPAATCRASAAPPPPAPAGPRGSETVLVVEDQVAVRRIIDRLLTQQGYDVLPAGHAAEAVRIATRHPGPIHLLLSDIVMPGMNGRDLAEWLVEQRPELRVLFMSGYAAASAERALHDGDTDMVRKPFTPERLCGAVRAALDRPAAAGRR
jgi:two-component system, cell cycle sensor histidine kinase and response regulator CckA